MFECGTEYQISEQRRAIYSLLTELGYEMYCFGDFLFDKGALSYDEFRKCGLYPFRAFNFVATASRLREN